MFVISNENAKIQIISDIYNIFITKKGKEYPKPDAKQRCRESGQCAKMKKAPHDKNIGGGCNRMCLTTWPE
jgi:hypothetical protein